MQRGESRSIYRHAADLSLVTAICWETDEGTWPGIDDEGCRSAHRALPDPDRATRPLALVPALAERDPRPDRDPDPALSHLRRGASDRRRHAVIGSGPDGAVAGG